MLNKGNKLFNKIITASSKRHSLFQDNTLADDLPTVYVDSHCQTLESGGFCAEKCAQTEFDINTVSLGCICVYTENVLSQTFPQTVIHVQENSDDDTENTEINSPDMPQSLSACESSTQTFVNFQ